MATTVISSPISPPMTAQKGSTMPMKIKPEVQLDAGGHGRQHFLGVAGQLHPGDRDQPDGFGEDQPGHRRQQHIDAAEGQADDPADGKNPPFPAFLLFFGGFGQGHGAQGAHRRHGKGQFFHVRGDPVEGVAQAEVVDALDDLGADEQQDGDQPVPVKKGALHQGVGVGAGATQVGMNSVSPSIRAASDWTRYWLHSSP